MYYQKNATESSGTLRGKPVKHNDGSVYAWWLRSPPLRRKCILFGLSRMVLPTATLYSYNISGVAPGFVHLIKRKKQEEYEKERQNEEDRNLQKIMVLH